MNKDHFLVFYFSNFKGGGGPRKVECLVTSHIQCFAGLFYSEPPRTVSDDEQIVNMTFKMLSNKNQPNMLPNPNVRGTLNWMFELNLFQKQCCPILMFVEKIF